MKKIVCLLGVLFSYPLFSQVVINEVMVRNISTVMDESGNYTSYLELYNPSASTYTFSGNYLSNDKNNLQKFKIQEGLPLGSKKFLVYWCDKVIKSYHTNFSLDANEGTIYLSNSSGVILDSVTYKQQYVNISLGRYPDGVNTWTYFLKGTPGKINNTAFGSEQLKKVQFDKPSGYYTGRAIIALSAEPGTRIHYTTNGAEPTETSKLFSYAIASDTNIVIRARAFANGYLPSDIVTQTYFVNQRSIGMPVISISTDPKNLWDNIIGIYVYGTNGIMGNGVTIPANFNQDWERPANFEFFDVAKKRQLNLLTGIKVHGAYSRKNAEKSLLIKVNERYGVKSIDFPFFNDKKSLPLKTFVLRNSGNDWNNSMLRDGFMQTLVQGKMNIDYMSYQPSVVFINGRYWGIHNIREEPGTQYVWSNYHYDPDSIDLCEWDGVADEGSNVSYKNMLAYLKANDITQPQHYDYICTQMDVDEYMNYIITQSFLSNNDWPGNNNKYWHLQQPNARWRWFLYDTDFGFGIWGRSPDFNMITWIMKAGGTSGANQDWATFLPRTLLKNPTFRQEFINRYTSYLGTIFSSQRTTYILDSCQKNINAEMSYHFTRWGGYYGSWTNEINVMKSFGQQRPANVYRHLQQMFDLGDPLALNIHSSIPGGSFNVNNVIATDSAFKGMYFQNSNLTVDVFPPSGYKFKNWKVHYYGLSGGNFFTKNSAWRYLDNGSEPDTTWRYAGFDDSGWKTGRGEFGYGDNDEFTPISYGTISTNKYITTYFRKSVTIKDTVGISKVNLNLIVDDGAIIYLNGKELVRVNMPVGPCSNSTLALADYENYNYKTTIDKNLLIPGDNLFAVEIHQVNASNADVSFDLAVSYDKITIAPADSILTKQSFADTMRFGMDMTAYYEIDTTSRKIIINEITAENTTEKDEFGQTDDWIELYNPNDSAVDIAGLFITDSLKLARKHRIPVGYPKLTTIPAKGYLRLWADNQPYQGPLHLAFNLNQDGEQLGLSQYKGTQMSWIDTVSFGYQDDLYSYGRYPDGSKKMMYMKGTPKDTNVAGYTPDTNIHSLFINEICADNDSALDEFGNKNDWMEVYNPSADTIDMAGMLFTDKNSTCRIPYGFSSNTKILPKQFSVLWCDNKRELGPLHLNFKLEKSGETAGIMQLAHPSLKKRWIDSISYGYQDSLYSYGRYTDGTPTLMYMKKTPGATNVKGYKEDSLTKSIIINEISADNLTFADEYGDKDDWMELYNPTDDSIDIAGILLSNRWDIENSYRIPYNTSKTIISPKGFMVIWCDGQPAQGSLHASLKLSKTGEFIGVFQSINKNIKLLDSVIYPVQQSGFSYGRYTDGKPSWFFMIQQTPGLPNKKDTIIIDNLKTEEEGITVFPNPASNFIMIQSIEYFPADIRIINASGITIMQKNYSENPAVINISHLEGGLYIVSVSAGEKKKYYKFVKE